ncbi:MAG: hypothetical protein ACRDRJ_05530 [Streptosporangiaceae bacterium]
MIVLERDRTGMRDIFRSYTVVVDGNSVGKIKRGERLELPIAVGHHRIHLQIDWGRSPKLDIDARAGDVIRFSCRPGGSPAAGFRDAFSGSEGYISFTLVSG